MSKFDEEIGTVIARQLGAAQRLAPEARAAAFAEILQVLAKALGGTCAIVSNGNSKLCGVMMEGATNYAMEEATAAFAFVPGVRRKKRAADS